MITRLSLPGTYAWAVWQPERSIFFWSYLLLRDDGNVAVDPLPLDEAGCVAIEALGGVRKIVITNRDHVRASEALCARFDAELIPPGTFADGEQVVPGLHALAMRGAKSEDEIALVLPEHKAAIVGDAIMGIPAGALSLLPDEKLADRISLVRSLRRLWQYQLDALLLCDGMPLLSGADQALAQLIESAGGPAMNAINLDEVEWKRYDDVGGKYASEDAEIGLLIGARKLGYRFTRLMPGARFCPLHAHDKEEEFFYVIEGTPTIRTLRGNVRLRPGDVIAFPTGERGAHQVLNESEAPCLLLLAGLADPDDVCYYPDSEKILVERHGLMLHTSPALEYYHGE